MPEFVMLPTTVVERLRSQIRVELGLKRRTWGGWVRRDIVKCGEVEIGHVQVRRRNRRTESLTGDMAQRCVLGTDLSWLLREAVTTGLVAAEAPE